MILTTLKQKMLEGSNDDRRSERGNALFLILIAVALFAALSYAITQSVSGGGTGSDQEQNRLDTATLTQFPVAVSTALTRMSLQGADLTTIDFDPNDGTAADDLFGNDGVGVDGGLNLKPPPVSLQDGDTVAWTINASNIVTGVGTGAADVVMFLDGLPLTTCQLLNEELAGATAGAAPPVVTTDFVDANGANVTTGLLTAGTTTPTDAGTTFVGEPTYCVQRTSANSSTYLFYYVVLPQ